MGMMVFLDIYLGRSSYYYCVCFGLVSEQFSPIFHS